MRFPSKNATRTRSCTLMAGPTPVNRGESASPPKASPPATRPSTSLQPRLFAVSLLNMGSLSPAQREFKGHLRRCKAADRRDKHFSSDRIERSLTQQFSEHLPDYAAQRAGFRLMP